MKQLAFLLLFVCSLAQAAITDLKLSTAQIFDVQWYISAGKLNASGFNYIYASINYATQTTSAARWTSAQTADAGSNGRYIGFVNSPTVSGTYGMAVFNSNGTIYKWINYTGSFRALADGAIFYNGNGMWGTLITTGAGYNLGSSGQFTITQEYPTNTQLQAYTPPSSTPLAAGQTAAPVAPALCCGGSSAAFNATTTNTAKAQAFVGRTTQDSKVYVDQVGNQNTITINQTGTSNNSATYVSNGSSNTTIITQSGTASTTANIVDLTVNGNYNTTTITQTSTGGAKGVFATVTDNNNSLIVQQKDAGNHYAEISLAGGNKNVDVLQQGSAHHMAKIGLTGLPTDLSLTQSGSTQNYYSIQFNCATTGGCPKITVTQGQ